VPGHSVADQSEGTRRIVWSLSALQQRGRMASHGNPSRIVPLSVQFKRCGRLRLSTGQVGLQALFRRSRVFVVRVVALPSAPPVDVGKLGDTLL
jgi:hypothetical protein